jgi:hypothetical protein
MFTPKKPKFINDQNFKALGVLMYILWCIVYSFILGSGGYNIVKSLIKILLISILVLNMIFPKISLPPVVILSICFAVVVLSIMFAVQSYKVESDPKATNTSKKYSGIVKWYNFVLILLLNAKIIYSINEADVFGPHNTRIIFAIIIIEIILAIVFYGYRNIWA